MVAESEQAFSKWMVVYCCLRALEMCEIFTFGKKSVVQEFLGSTSCLDLEATLVEDGMNKANSENDAQLVSFVL